MTGEALEPRRERDPLPPTAEDDEDVVDDVKDDIDNKGTEHCVEGTAPGLVIVL